MLTLNYRELEPHIQTGRFLSTLIDLEVDGKTIRVPLPDMSRDRRQEFVKNAHRMAEEGRVHVRNVRRDVLETAKRAKLPEDESKRLEKDIQAATDKAIADINAHLAHKEKDLLTV